jgi:branched-chain amino acid transport system ATP-binding protein
MSGAGSALQVDGLSVSFGGVRALHDVTFQVEPHKIVGIMGPNGAGKTTLFNLITGVYRPSIGTIRFGGRELQGLPPSRICDSGIARTFQSARPFANMTARENVLTGLFYGTRRERIRSEASREAQRLLDFVGLTRQADRPVSSLNLMERKIVELARALATGPKLLLLDELLAGLNPTDLAPAIGIIRKIRDELGVTVFWIEHIMQVLMNTCEHLIVLHHGEKLAEGAPQAIVSDANVAAAYFGKKGPGTLV